MLVVHRAERADALVGALGELLNVPSDDPFRPEIVAVPSKGVERWLAQQLGHLLGARTGDGVCANILFPSYTSFLDERIAEADEEYAAAVEAWAPDRAMWQILDVIARTAATEPWGDVLVRHLNLGGADDSGRRVAVAAKVARLYDSYGRSRPDMIKAWHDGRAEQGDGAALPKDLRWQVDLWQRVREAIGIPCPAELLETACKRVNGGLVFSIFGATRIPPVRVAVLHSLAEHRDVHLWLHHPSPALWEAVKGAGERPTRRVEQVPIAANALLASTSRDVRELQQLITDAPYEDHHHPLPTRSGTLLARIQQELATDAVPTTRGPVDRTIQIHATHGPARQVEVIREVILGLLAEDPSLEPRDILVMCPDVEVFAPLVGAAFGMADEPGAHPAAKLRVKLADRALRQTNPLLKLLSHLLNLAGSRVTATEMLDLAGLPPVRRMFDFDDDNLERMRDWVVSAGARWGLDAVHRDAYGLSAVEQNTWRFALDRLLLGAAMEEDAEWVGRALPLDDVDSADIDLAGRIAEFVDRVDDAVRRLTERRTVGEWTDVLDEIVNDLGEADHAWQIQVRRELDDLAEAAASRDTEIGLADLTFLLGARLAGRPSRANFRTGTLTVCTLVPMRSVPHRVVCLTGMDDGAFPRKGIPDGDDVLARDPRSGERDVRSEDRQLFLDAICAAQEYLVIAYSGANPRTGAVIPPCVPVGELIEAIDTTAASPDGGRARDHVVVRHPLQPFDPRNFRPNPNDDGKPFSFDPQSLAGARAAARPRSAPRPLISAPLEPADNITDTIGLDELIRFLQHPVRGFLRQRLEMAMSVDEEEPADALSIKVPPLDGWGIGDRVLRRCMGGTAPGTAVTIEVLRGQLPPGALGGADLREIGGRVDALLAASADERRLDAVSCDVDVELPDGRRVVGTVNGVRGSAIVDVTYSKLAPKHRITAWARYLALAAVSDDEELRAVTIGRRSNGAARSVFRGLTQGDARQHLETLVRFRDVGLLAPVPYALKTSEEYATRRRRNMTEANALKSACRQWETGEYAERNEREHVLVFGRDASFAGLTDGRPAAGEEFADESTRFGALARQVWDPALAAESSR